MNEVLVYIPPEKYCDDQVLMMCQLLKNSNVKVVSISQVRGKLSGHYGSYVTSDMHIDDVQAFDKYSGIVIFDSMNAIMNDSVRKKIIDLLEQCYHQDKCLCLCGKQAELIFSCTFAKGCKITLPLIEDLEAKVKKSKSIYTGDPYTVDKHVITLMNMLYLQEAYSYIIDKINEHIK